MPETSLSRRVHSPTASIRAIARCSALPTPNSHGVPGTATATSRPTTGSPVNRNASAPATSAATSSAW